MPPQLSPPPNAIPRPPHQRPAVKSRSGCEQCKRRKVKCDERQPTCSRCIARRETCTGNFQCDPWQVERPWISHTRTVTPVSVMENDALRHWYAKACLNMAIFHPPVNPLSHDLSVWLVHSRALRHTLECVAEAHREYFRPGRLGRALEIRGRAIISLHSELARIRTAEQSSPYKHAVLLRTAVLSSMILCVSSSWLDPTTVDVGIEFLSGAKGLIEMLAASGHLDDPLSFYALGLFLYWMAFSSYLVPSDMPVVQASPSILDALTKPPFDTCVHPVTGISATLCPLIAEAGLYYRRTVDLHARDPALVTDLTQRLLFWQPPASCPDQPQLVQLAEGYRHLGLIMLCQAQSITDEDVNNGVILEHVFAVMELLQHIPQQDPLLNWFRLSR
ncbi:hypothetical protein F5X68DRAFT_231891 [Plectosphaerella plurivora]|uniref:Zn(2)-C6 fungal-type domain-containing protein n=1 Tax=Plectosphaerella plurivora TaxID=936078 RepID=A0A9P8VCB9_9PEZI|nr:hypothetical protein F5X68DRAFT_231891 [Plectosphaerella plurivora]